MILVGRWFWTFRWLGDFVFCVWDFVSEMVEFLLTCLAEDLMRWLLQALPRKERRRTIHETSSSTNHHQPSSYMIIIVIIIMIYNDNNNRNNNDNNRNNNDNNQHHEPSSTIMNHYHPKNLTHSSLPGFWFHLTHHPPKNLATPSQLPNALRVQHSLHRSLLPYKVGKAWILSPPRMPGGKWRFIYRDALLEHERTLVKVRLDPMLVGILWYFLA